MKLYMEIANYGYDGGIIVLGVYSTVELAESKCSSYGTSWYFETRVDELVLDVDFD